MMHRNRFPQLFALLALCAVTGCCTTSRAHSLAPGALEFLQPQTVVAVTQHGSGDTWISFETSARYFRIAPALSPEAPALLKKARASMESGRQVHATAWIDVPLGPDEDRLPPVLVRIESTPDPRAGE
jgi:hypothetical protein